MPVRRKTLEGLKEYVAELKSRRKTKEERFDEGFFFCPYKITSLKNITHSDKSVMALINSFTIKNKRFSLKNKTIGKILGICENQANISINKLAKLGYIIIEDSGKPTRKIISTDKLNYLNPPSFVIEYLSVKSVEKSV